MTEELSWCIEGSRSRELQRGSRQSATVGRWVKRCLDRAKRAGWSFTGDPVITYSDAPRDLFVRNRYVYTLTVRVARPE